MSISKYIAGLEINKILKSHLSTKWQKIVAKCKFLVAKSNRTQSIDIHEVLNAQGFAMHYRAISNRGSHFEVFERGERSERVVYFCVPWNNQTWLSSWQSKNRVCFIISIRINCVFHPQEMFFFL